MHYLLPHDWLIKYLHEQAGVEVYLIKCSLSVVQPESRHAVTDSQKGTGHNVSLHIAKSFDLI